MEFRLKAIVNAISIYHVILKISNSFYTYLNNKRDATCIFYIMFYHIIVSSRYNHVDGDISSKSIQSRASNVLSSMFHLLAPSSLLSPAMPPQSVFRCNNALYSAHAIPFYGVSRAIIYYRSTRCRGNRSCRDTLTERC